MLPLSCVVAAAPASPASAVTPKRRRAGEPSPCRRIARRVCSLQEYSTSACTAERRRSDALCRTIEVMLEEAKMGGVVSQVRGTPVPLWYGCPPQVNSRERIMCGSQEFEERVYM